ncbi:MAG: efflux RND transporter periplasmic adaptor subunit [Candidatus Gracilibacteria bacterium]
MSKKIAIFLLGILTLTILSGCAITDIFSKPKKIARFVTDQKIARAATIDESNLKTVEVFNLSKETPTLFFTKSAIAESKEIAYIVPQTSGKVVKINTEVGDKVNKGTLLITLGNSLATDVADIQYQSAIKALGIATNSETITNNTTRKSVQTAALGAKMAYESYQTAIKSQNNAENIYDEQYDNAKDGKNDIKDGKQAAEDGIEKLESTISELENQKAILTDTLSKLDPLDTSREEISKSLEEIEAILIKAKEQKVTLETALEAADNGLDQAKNGLDLLEVSFEAQQDQLEFAVFAAELQYEIAINQFEIAANAAELQNLGVQTQILQLDSAVKIAELSNEQKYIKSPIKGYVTDIQATENNLIAPGQMVAKVEDPSTLSLKVNLNDEEAQFVTQGQKLTIQYGSKSIEGKVISISPSFSDTGKKISVKIEAENKNLIVTPGALVKVEFSSKTQNRIFIPLNSLRNNDTQQFVTVIKNNKATLQNIKIGEIVGDYVEVLAGLNGTETILKTADNFLNEGDSVTIQTK